MTYTAPMLDTKVVASTAVLAPPPAAWSYSSLHDVTNCPRRYALTRASYPDLWEGQGYPSLPSVASLFGDVVHGVLETVVKAMSIAGVGSPRAPEASRVLRELGGLTELIEEGVTSRIEALTVNPRLDADRRRRVARELRSKVAEARSQVQTYLSRTSFSPRTPTSSDAGVRNFPGGMAPLPLSTGSHAEVWLTATELPIRGRVDLLTVDKEYVEILDYKTGAPSGVHHDQLRLYALLWDLDRKLNPARRPATRLVAAYGSTDVVLSAPNPSELRVLESMVASQVRSAEIALAVVPPQANPSKDVCRFCPVRQLCAAYWTSLPADTASLADGDWFDFEGEITAQNGPRSWWLRSPNSGKLDVLLRSPSETPLFGVGDKVRLLGLRVTPDPEVGAFVAQVTGTTEVFLLSEVD